MSPKSQVFRLPSPFVLVCCVTVAITIRCAKGTVLRIRQEREGKRDKQPPPRALKPHARRLVKQAICDYLQTSRGSAFVTVGVRFMARV